MHHYPLKPALLWSLCVSFVICSSFHYNQTLFWNPKSQAESIPSFTFHEILSRQEQVRGRGAYGINTLRKCAHLWSSKLPPAWISHRWKVPNPSLDELIFSGPLCSFTVTDWEPRGRLARTKIKRGIKEENRTQLEHLYNLPYLTPEH